MCLVFCLLFFLKILDYHCLRHKRLIRYRFFFFLQNLCWLHDDERVVISDVHKKTCCGCFLELPQ